VAAAVTIVTWTPRPAVCSNACASRPTPPPSHYRPDLDPALDRIVLRALALRPEDRFADVRQFAAALAGWLEHGAASLPPAPDALTPASGRTSARPTKSLPPAAVSTMLQNSSRPPVRFGRRSLIAAGLAVVGLATAGLLLADWLNRNPRHVEPTNPSPGAITLPVKGYIDVRIWENKDAKGQRNPDRQGLYLHQVRALPLKVNDQVRVEVELNQPLFVYVVWINSKGEAMPVYPWGAFDWKQRPDGERPVQSLRLPEGAADDGWEMDKGPPGMETLVLLACETELPRDFDLKGRFAGLKPQEMQNDAAAVWFENGRVVHDEANRAPKQFDPTRIDDPVLQTQRLLQEQLGPHFLYTRAVSFAFRGQ
jgi:hypothetical protein